MRIKVTRGYKSYHIELIQPDRVRHITLLAKDERFRREHFMLCTGLMKLYFPEFGKLKEYKEVCEFDDRGFFRLFPDSFIGKMTT